MMFDKKIFALNISSGLILKFMSMVLIFFVYKEIGQSQNTHFTTTWLTLYAIVAGLSTIDFGVGASIKNQLIHDSEFTYDLSNVVYSYLFIGLINCLFFFGLLLVNGITFFDVNNWFYFFSCVFFLVYPLLRFSISIMQADRRDWLASLSFFCLNFLLFITVFILKVIGLDDVFYYYALYLSFTIPVICTTLIYLKAILKKSMREYFSFKKLYLVTAKSFFFIQIALFLMNSTNDVIFNILGDTTLINYQYGYRIFSISVILATVVSMVIWSNLGTNLRLNYKLISKSYLGIYFLLLFALNCFLMLIVNPVLEQFFELKIIITATQLFSLSVMSSLLSFIFILSAFLNCLNIIDRQVGFWSVAVVFKVVLIFLVTRLVGEINFIVVFSSIFAYFIVVLLCCHSLIKTANFERGITSV